MAHFAELNAQQQVLRVVVIGNQDCLDENGQESEAVGIAFCRSVFGGGTNWIQTSYNGNVRGKYAGIGDTYDPVADLFIPPSPYPSWTFDVESMGWQAPQPYPSDGLQYVWGEDEGQWQLLP